MKEDFFKEKTLEEKFKEALFYIELNEFPQVTFCGLDICSLKYCRDIHIMTQIIDIVDALKIAKMEEQERRSHKFVRSNLPFKRKPTNRVFERNVI